MDLHYIKLDEASMMSDRHGSIGRRSIASIIQLLCECPPASIGVLNLPMAPLPLLSERGHSIKGDTNTSERVSPMNISSQIRFTAAVFDHPPRILQNPLTVSFNSLDCFEKSLSDAHF